MHGQQNIKILIGVSENQASTALRNGKPRVAVHPLVRISAII